MNIIGIDIGGTKCAVLYAQYNDLKPQIIEKEVFKAPGNFERYYEQICKIIDLYIDKYDVHKIGISCGGPLNPHTGLILGPPNLPGFVDIEIVKMLEERYKITTKIQNDANACALAEYIFGNHNENNMIFATFSTGMGAGLILDGKLYSGTNGLAGEIGHMGITKDGPYGYDKFGSFEGYVSGSGIAYQGKLLLHKCNLSNLKSKIKEYDTSDIDAKLIFTLANEGDEECIKIIENSMEILGFGLANLVDILNPQLIILGSLYTRQKTIIDKYMYPIFNKNVNKLAGDVCQIKESSLGEEIGDFAAVAVALQ